MQKNSVSFPLRACSEWLSLLYNTELLLGNTLFSLQPEVLTMTNPLQSDTIITGWGGELHSHLLIELSPSCTLLLSVAHSNISRGCYSPQKATTGERSAAIAEAVLPSFCPHTLCHQGQRSGRSEGILLPCLLRSRSPAAGETMAIGVPELRGRTELTFSCAWTSMSFARLILSGLINPAF